MINCNAKVAFRFVLILGILMSAALSGCRHAGSASDGANGNTPADTVAPDVRAFNMMKEGKPFEEYMPVQMEAVAQLREGHPKSDAIDILSQTGHMLMRHGDYEESLMYLQEASDSARSRVDAGRIDKSMIQMLGNVGIVYAHFGLNEEALAKNSEAIEISVKLGHEHYSDLWRMRAAMYNMMLQNSDNRREVTDSILHCIQMAYNAIPKMPEEYRDEYTARCNFDKAALFVENPVLFPDSISEAIALLKSTTYPNKQASVDVLLGRAFVLTGKADDGLALMEKGLEDFRRQDWKESVDWSLDLLAQSYAEAGRGDRLAKIYPEVRDHSRQLMNETKINALIGNDFRYRLKEKQREVVQLQEKNNRYRAVVLLSISAAVVGLLIGIFLAIIYMKQRVRAHSERERYLNEIKEILSHQVALNSKIEHLNEQLDSKENANVVENVTLQLDPTLLCGDDEVKFRKAFMTLHPRFLTNLRRDFPVLTSADELLCMLIYLKVPPLDMAAALGISRASLNSARYRIRKRLNLDKDTSLDSFIGSIA